MGMANNPGTLEKPEGSKWSLILKLCAVASIAIMAIVAFSGGAPTNKEVAASQTITKLVGVMPPREASRRLKGSRAGAIGEGGEAKKKEIEKVETEEVTKGDGETEDVRKKKVEQDTPKPPVVEATLKPKLPMKKKDAEEETEDETNYETEKKEEKGEGETQEKKKEK